MTKFVNTPVIQDSADFTAAIRNIERSDKFARRLDADLFPLGELLRRENVFNTVQIFNWLAQNSIKIHKRGEKQYIELILCRQHANIIQAMRQVFLTSTFGFWALKHFSAQGIFATHNRKNLWQYPSYSRRDVNQMDVNLIVNDVAEGMAW